MRYSVAISYEIITKQTWPTATQQLYIAISVAQVTLHCYI